MNIVYQNNLIHVQHNHHTQMQCLQYEHQPVLIKLGLIVKHHEIVHIHVQVDIVEAIVVFHQHVNYQMMMHIVVMV